MLPCAEPVDPIAWGGWLAHTHYWIRNALDTDPMTAPLPNLRLALELARKRKCPLTPQAAASTPETASNE